MNVCATKTKNPQNTQTVKIHHSRSALKKERIELFQAEEKSTLAYAVLKKGMKNT